MVVAVQVGLFITLFNEKILFCLCMSELVSLNAPFL